MANKAACDGQTEVSVLIPTRSYRRSWAFLLHGKNADRLVRVLGHVPHVNATLVPFNVADLAESQRALATSNLVFDGDTKRPAPGKGDHQRFAAVPGATPISDAAVPSAHQGRRAAPFSSYPAVDGRGHARGHADGRERR